MKYHCIDTHNLKLTLCGRQVSKMNVDGTRLQVYTPYNFNEHAIEFPDSTCLICFDIWNIG